MINVCSQCLRPNPLGREKCVYCGSDCQQLESQEYGQFCLRRKQKEVFEENSCPDLKVFTDCRKMDDQFELIIARP